MSITDDQHRKLTDMLIVIEQDMDSLTASEDAFVKDQIARHKQWGQAIFLSDKQWNWLEKIHAKVSGEGPQATDERMNNRGRV